MNNQMQVFENSEFGKIEVLEIDGKPYFPATKCAEIIGHTNPARAIREFCKGVTETVTPTSGGIQAVKIIPESDLYRLIIRSKLPAAEKFERWVFDDVLPTIRKHGLYAADDLLAAGNEDMLINALLKLKEERAEKAKLEAENKRLALPAAKYQGLAGGGLFETGQIAKEYGMKAVDLNRFLHNWRVIYKPCGSKTWQLYTDYAGKGYALTRLVTCNGHDIPYLYWTAKGRDLIIDLLDEHLGGVCV